MRTRAIRPGENRADHQPNTTPTTSSDGWKSCRQCETWKPLDDMAVDNSAKDGRRSICREHRRAYDRARYQENSESILAQQRQYRQDNPGVGWFRDYKRRARTYGLDPVGQLLTREEIIEHWGDSCFYCPEGAFEQIDHFDAVAACGHHTIDNVVPCCAACNVWKRWAIDEAAIQLFRAAQAGTGG